MHEFSITSSIISILKKIADEKKLKNIKKINLLLNPLGGVEKESVQFYFEFLSKDDPLFKNCCLVFKKDTLKAICLDCESEFESSLNELGKCKFCNSSNIKIITSDDISIISIDV
ncbi:MAG: hydrogenase/urease maturation nickel metallochaperone HypA [Actinomycetota bacterium]|jgi:hydrogenase nickel incorporation protein HypA/HybF|nr:hydrogenase/urease maturation nickel metallochaperone HypA [Actinomycetota bacterium]